MNVTETFTRPATRPTAVAGTTGPAPATPQPPARAEARPHPQPPAGLGADLPDGLRAGLHALLLEADGHLQSVYQARVSHPKAVTITQLQPHTTCAVASGVSKQLATVNAVLNRQIPAGPSVARQAASAIRALLKKATQPDVRDHLTDVLARLDARAGDPIAERRETAELEAQSLQFEKTAEERLRNSPGVYVYTYPHYWTHPYEPGTERRLLKVGKTDGAFARIRAQVRQTGAPEEPLLLRVYLAPDPADTERTFHRLLDAAEHNRSQGSTVGREWFNTTIDFCDEIAGALHLQVLAADVPS